MTYVDNTHLNADIAVGSEWNKAKAYITVVEQSQTPHDAVIGLYYVPIKNGNLHVTAKGTSFVNGHMIEISYLLVKL